MLELPAIAALKRLTPIKNLLDADEGAVVIDLLRADKGEAAVGIAVACQTTLPPPDYRSLGEEDDALSTVISVMISTDTWGYFRAIRHALIADWNAQPFAFINPDDPDGEDSTQLVDLYLISTEPTSPELADGASKFEMDVSFQSIHPFSP